MRPSRHRRPGLAPVVAGALLLAATGVGAAVRAADRPAPDAGVVPTGSARAGAPSGTAPSAGAPSGTAPAPSATSRTAAKAAGAATLTPAPDRSFLPSNLRVAAIGAVAPVVPTTVDDKGGLGIPDNPRQVGWWSGGAAPGSPYGTVLLAGHVDSAEEGLGSLVDLSRTPIGATVRVSGPAGVSQAYLVVARRSYPKATLPWRELFRQDVPARLLLVTCGGEFDRSTGHYERNVVVFAVPA
ncbi:Sortase family protein [Pedococcus cremeus]|uniref:Sortase family protein n=1 Tax=Pedococcus cremeus TaxID=587636 RepID=A0A1H9XTE4_9MICO|nr:class F sortase [Pedococcus cremeus]SES49396.1 Sortase family protein [Pedococcus cremeus]